MTRTIAFALAAILIPVAAILAIDTIVLKNGTMMEGNIDSVDRDQIRLSFFGGQSTLQRGQVAAIHFDKNAEEVRRLMTPPATPPGTQPGVLPLNPSQPGQPPTVMPAADDLGVWKQSGNLRMRITKASIGQVSVRDFTGRVTLSKEIALIVEMEINNPSDRALKFRVPPFGQPFTLKDESGRGIPQEFVTGEVVDALRSGQNIASDSTVKHIELFAQPARLGAGKFTLNVDTKVFGQRDDLEFKLLPGSIWR